MSVLERVIKFTKHFIFFKVNMRVLCFHIMDYLSLNHHRMSILEITSEYSCLQSKLKFAINSIFLDSCDCDTGEPLLICHFSQSSRNFAIIAKIISPVQIVDSQE